MKKESFEFYCQEIDRNVKLLKEEIEKQEDWTLKSKSMEKDIVHLLMGYGLHVTNQRGIKVIEELKVFLEETKANIKEYVELGRENEGIQFIDDALENLEKMNALLTK